MRHRIVLGALALTMLAAAGAVGGEGLKSGPQAGSGIGGAYDVLNVTGKAAGSKNCQV